MGGACRMSVHSMARDAGHAAGTRARLACSFPMRTLLLTPLLLLAACGDRQSDGNDSQPGVVTNIMDKGVPDADQVPEAGNEAMADNGAADAEEAGLSGDSLPPAVRGRWAGLNEKCGDRLAVQELTVDADRLLFHESEGQVRQVERGADGALTVRADFTGEGQSWTRSLRLQPSDDGKRLVVVNDGTSITRKRCP